jgi:hypothetical protein
LLSTTIFWCGRRSRQEQVDDGEIPCVGVLLKPVRARALRLCHAHGLDVGQFFKRGDQVLADRRIVFNKIGAQFHGCIQ